MEASRPAVHLPVLRLGRRTRRTRLLTAEVIAGA